MTLKSDSHVYVFVNLRKKGERPEYIVAPSTHVAAKVVKSTSKSEKASVFYSFYRKDRLYDDEGWSLLGDPHPTTDSEEVVPRADEISN